MVSCAVLTHCSQAQLKAVEAKYKKDAQETETELDRVVDDNDRLYKENDRLREFKMDYDRVFEECRKARLKLAETERDWEKERHDRLKTLDELEDTKLRVFNWEMKYYEASGMRPPRV